MNKNKNPELDKKKQAREPKCWTQIDELMYQMGKFFRYMSGYMLLVMFGIWMYLVVLYVVSTITRQI